VGLAYSDPTAILVSRVETLEVRGPRIILREIAARVRDEEVTLVVLGLPLSLDGTEKRTAAIVREFGDRLLEEIHVPLLYWDERLTSVEAERRLRETNEPRIGRRGRIDAFAAGLLLESYLTRMNLGGGGTGGEE
jgi:putative Holliday junction resolvase